MTEQPVTNKTVLAVLVQEASDSKTDGWLTIPTIIERLGWDGQGDWLQRREDVSGALNALVAEQFAERREHAGADEFRAIRGVRIAQKQSRVSGGRHRRQTSIVPAIA